MLTEQTQQSEEFRIMSNKKLQQLCLLIILKTNPYQNQCLLSHCFDKLYIPHWVGNTCQIGSRQGIKAMSLKNSDGIRVGWF